MKPAKPIRILHSEDHELMRYGLRYLLQHEPEMELVGEATNFAQTLAFQNQLAPDVILLDLALDQGSVMERIPELLNGSMASKVIAVTAAFENETYRRAFQMGAMGVCTTRSPGTLLLKAIRAVHADDIWIDRQTASAFANLARSADNAAMAPSNLTRLTPRQHEIACFAAQGLPVKAIANKMNISDKTVRNQLSIIYGLLDVSGQIDLALKAQLLGLTKPANQNSFSVVQ
jgi:DNA-binding NarL/FixJ family response regulator